MGKLIITIFLASVLLISFIGCVVLISLQEEDGPDDTDTKPPQISFISPEASSIFAPGNNISILVDTNEDDTAITSVMGKITDAEAKVDLIEFQLNYSGDNEWKADIELPSDSPDGDWYIYIQAWDKNGNMGWVELRIRIHR